MFNKLDDIIDENDLMKRCFSCGNISLKSIFHKTLSSKDGLNPNCNVCRKKYYDENLVKIKKYYLENRNKFISQQNEYKK